MATKRHNKRKGNAMLEAALAFPTLMLMLFGVIDFSNLFMMNVANTSAARSGAQIAFNNPGLFDGEDADFNASKGQISAAVDSDNTTTTRTTTVTRTCYCAGNDGTLGSQVSCPVSCTNGRVFVKVSTSSAVSPVVRYPLIAYPTNVVATAVVRVQ